MAEPTHPPTPEPEAADEQIRPESRWRKIGRLFFFSVVVSGLGAGLFARSVYADAQEAALTMGGELGKLGEPGLVRAVRINDQAINVVSKIDPRPFMDVLDQIELACDQRTAGLRDVMNDLPEEVRARLPEDARGSGTGTMRMEGVREGFVACLIRDEPTKGVADFLERMSKFTETGDLSELGNIRYVYARATAPDKSHVVVAWTDGSLQIRAFAPEPGTDAPGSDVEGFPRPPDSVRIMTAKMDGTPYGIRLYQTKAQPLDVVNGYEQRMSTGGWLLTKPEHQPNGRAFSRGPLDVMVFAEPHEGGSMVSLVDIRSPN